MSERGPSHCLLSLSAGDQPEPVVESLTQSGPCATRGADELGELSAHMQRAMLVGSVASGYVHDLNTLLMIVELTAYTVANELPADHPARRELDLLRQANDAAKALSRQLLAFVRRKPTALKVVDLGALLECSLPLAARLVGSRLCVQLEVAPGLLPIAADPVQIDQILLNMLLNARDASPHGGAVTISAANVCAGAAEGLVPGRYVCLTISDTGMGMGRETLARLFEPFYSDNQLREGTGLGLSTCRYLVQLLGGTITVESIVGAGTTFRIYLPPADLDDGV